MKKLLLFLSLFVSAPCWAVVTFYYVTPSGSDSTGTGTSGNPYATPGKACGVMAASDVLYVKAGTYTATSGTINVGGGYCDPPSGTSDAPTQIIGYNVSTGDLMGVYDYSNFPVIRNSASGNTTNMRTSNNWIYVYNLTSDSNGNGAYGFYNAGSNCIYQNCQAVNCTSFNGFYISGSSTRCIRCWSHNNGDGFNAGGSVLIFVDCWASSNTIVGFANANYITCIRCISWGNTGATTDGFLDSITNNSTYINCISVNNGRDGIRFSAASASKVVVGCIFGNNGGYNLNSTTAILSLVPFNFNAFYTSTSGDRNNVGIGPNDVALSGSPFVSPTSGNFALNNTAGQGAACRAAGYPGIAAGGTSTGYTDIGPIQHQDSGGGGGGATETNVIYNSTLIGTVLQ